MCSPYSSSTIGKSDTVGVCGTSSDQGFWYELGPGGTIVIGQSSNTFDSRHTLRYGGTYPGDNEVSCVDDPDYTTMTFTNTGASPMPVYFVVDGYATSSAGDFVLEWHISVLDLAKISRYDKQGVNRGNCSRNRKSLPVCVYTAAIVHQIPHH